MTESTVEPESRQWETASDHLGFLAVLVQVVLVALVMQALDLQTSAFRRVLYLATGGLVVHQYVPPRFRLHVFLILSLGATAMVLGTPSTFSRLWDPGTGLVRTIVLLSAGALLIGICHLPASFRLRVGLLLAAAGVVAVFRAGILPSGFLAIIWIILPAIFMFRIMIYLYDVSTSMKRPPALKSLAYFFMLPNVACTLFPVIDFRTFCTSNHDRPPLEISLRGAGWMGRGLFQLIAYRLVDQLLSLDPAEVASGADLIRFLLANSLIYLRVSGLFHLIIGMLLLFGFDLPEANHRYFLASSFTDYWRRVNIYWKDFMMKVFYYPTFFRLKSLGATKALALSTVWVFFVTWALHLYQTWWLKGSTRVTLPDALFWGILGLLVLLNSLWEMKRGRTRKLPSSRYTASDAAWLALRTAATFTCISLLWSLWNSTSVSAWTGLWRHADTSALLWGVVVLAAVMLATIFYEVLPKQAPIGEGQIRTGSIGTAFLGIGWRGALLRRAVPLLLVFLIAQPAVRSRLNPPWTQPFYDAFVAGDSHASGGLKGYYEHLAEVGEGDRQLWEVYNRQARHPRPGADPVRPVDDFRLLEPLPLAHVGAFDTDFRTNRWGMRDRDCDPVKPDGTRRLALLGSSHVMGWGVPKEEVMDTVLEDLLNSRSSPPAGGSRFEVLNFAFMGFSPLAQISLLRGRVRDFHPDLVLFVAHSNDPEWVSRDLAKAVHRKIPIRDEPVRETLRRARVIPRTPEYLAVQRLEALGDGLVEWSYRTIVEECRSMGATPVYVFMPLPRHFPLRSAEAEVSERLKALAVDAGFVMADLSSVFDGQDPAELQTRDPRDVFAHCNAKAHALVAQALYRTLTTDPRFDLTGPARPAIGAAGVMNNAFSVNRQP